MMLESDNMAELKRKIDIYLKEWKNSKNRKPLIVPVNQTMISILSEYLKYRQHKNTEEYLFCTLSHRPYQTA